MALTTPKFTGRLWQGGPREVINAGSKAGTAWFGRTPVTSTTITVSTMLVASDSILLFGLQQLAVGSEAIPMFVIRNVVPGVSFKVGTVSSWALTTSLALHWELLNAK